MVVSVFSELRELELVTLITNNFEKEPVQTY